MTNALGAETGPPSQAIDHIDALPAGTMLGEFEVQGLLGFGGFGMVYRGYDHSLQRAVAIKEYMPSALVARASKLELSVRSESDQQTFQSGLQSFIAEARLLARFDHPSLVKVYRFWEANNTAYMAMPLYQGITLKQARLQMSCPPPEEWLRVVLWSVLEALKVLHSIGALHRDVSPDNIFLQDIGPPVLLDLGAARAAVLEIKNKHTAVLKVNYAPIEQYADASDLREGPWTDIYALAAVVHGCICNEPPLPATFRVVRDRLPSLAKIAKTTQIHFGQPYSSSFIKGIDFALAIQPGDRPQTVEAFAKALKLRSVSRPRQFDWRSALSESVSEFSAPIATDETIPFGKPLRARIQQPSAPEALSQKVSGTRDRSVWFLPGVIASGLLLFLALLWRMGMFGGGTTALSSGTATTAQAPLAAISSPLRTSEPAVKAPEEVFIESNATAAKAADLSGTQQRLPKLSRTKVEATKFAEVQRPSFLRPNSEKVSELSLKEEVLLSAPPQGAANSKQETQVLCGDSNVFTRPMCVYRECQKPENANLQLCVEDKKRWEERDRARQR